jgi:hypothetical protein
VSEEQRGSRRSCGASPPCFRARKWTYKITSQSSDIRPLKDPPQVSGYVSFYQQELRGQDSRAMRRLKMREAREHRNIEPTRRCVWLCEMAVTSDDGRQRLSPKGTSSKFPLAQGKSSKANERRPSSCQEANDNARRKLGYSTARPKKSLEVPL